MRQKEQKPTAILFVQPQETKKQKLFASAFRVFILHNIIPVPPFRLILVRNRLCRAAPDTGHAVCAISFPYGFPINKRNVVQRAPLRTFPAGNAGIRYAKSLVMHLKGVK